MRGFAAIRKARHPDRPSAGHSGSAGRKGRFVGPGGDYAGALALYQQALAGFQAANPMAAEPLTLFTRQMDAVSAQISCGGPGAGVTLDRTGLGLGLKRD